MHELTDEQRSIQQVCRESAAREIRSGRDSWG